MFSGTPIHWRCTNCSHVWGATHSTVDMDEELLIDRPRRYREEPLIGV
jgi:hypothetical protein